MLHHIVQRQQPAPTNFTSPRIAFVGGGPSCVAVYLEIADQLSCEFREITIFDPLGVMQSTAFNCETETLLTNASVGVTSIKAHCDYDFLSWINSNHKNGGFTPASFVPRKLVAAYIKDRFSIARKHLESIGCSTQIIKRNVTNILAEPGNRFRLMTEDTAYSDFDFVIICTGCQSRLLPQHLNDHTDVIRSPYPESELIRQIAGAKKVLVLGTKLSAIDAALVMMSEVPSLQVTLASPSGTLPSVRSALLVHASRRFRAQNIVKHSTGTVLRQAIRAATQDMKEAKNLAKATSNNVVDTVLDQLVVDMNACEDGSNYWQASMGSFIDEINEIWPHFSLDEQLKFIKKSRKFNSRLISAFPYHNASKILDALQRKQLVVSTQQAENAVVSATGEGFEWRGNVGTEHFDKIVNATGVDTSSFAKSVLGQALQTQGWKLNAHGGIAVKPSTMRMKSTLAPNRALFAIGAPVTGSILITNYLRSSVIQAHRAVNHIHNLIHTRPLCTTSG